MIKIIRLHLLLLALVFCSLAKGQASYRPDVLMLKRMFSYASTVDTSHIAGTQTYAYTKFNLNVERRNIALLPVPTMYRIAHGPRRRYVGETYSKVLFKGYRKYESKPLITISTIPRHKVTLPTVQKYLTPEIYRETIIDDYILSPFHAVNKIYYRYSVSFLMDGRARITFKPKSDNTQLVRGEALVDYQSGRVISGYIRGEWDMVSFRLEFDMGDGGLQSLIPTRCKLQAQFNFVGNKINGQYTARYGLGKMLNDSARAEDRDSLMVLVRPEPLTDAEVEIYKTYYDERDEQRSTKKIKRERSWAKRLFWDAIGDHLLNKITSAYGTDDKGYLRINPLFNPLYMGYSGRRGFYYKFDIRTSYNFSLNSFFFARFKAGYSFKQKQFYYKIPIEYHFDRSRHGYVKFELGNGNWIKNGMARDRALSSLPDSASYDFERMEYFKDFWATLTANYDLSSKFSLQLGLMAHSRSAVERHTYQEAHMPLYYTSVAPVIELAYRPFGWSGPILNLSYERGIKGFLGADIAYERWEADLQHIIYLNRLRSLSLRAGAGLYSLVDGANYFLDYTNFRDNNIPGGWNDEWSGEFELLPAEWYNLSRYYVRSNVTYETPLLALSWLPWAGHFIEKERVYASALLVTHLHPYVEVGYGFTTRWVSLGFFMANRNGKYDGFGVKIGLELFRQW